MTGSKVWEVLEAAVQSLEQAQVPEARLVAELVLGHVVGCRRLELVLQRDRALTEPEAETFRKLLARAVAGEPVQYVIGETEFMGHRIRVDRRVLIPRPETEMLAEVVLACDDLWRRARPALADVGTGSGCIAIALALARPHADYQATDRSPHAIELARENAARLGAGDRIRFSCADLLDGVHLESLDAVVSNPPYVPGGLLESLPRNVRDFEPHTALDGGPDGLSVVWRLVRQSRDAVKSSGWTFLEIGEDQAGRVVSMMKWVGFESIRVVHDLTGRDRVVMGRNP
jgi:release factor glutamine methyltransferase